MGLGLWARVRFFVLGFRVRVYHPETFAVHVLALLPDLNQKNSIKFSVSLEE